MELPKLGALQLVKTYCAPGPSEIGDRATRVWVEPVSQENGVVAVVTGVLSTLTKPEPVAGLEVIVIETLCALAKCIKAAKMNRASRASTHVKAILFFIFFSS